MPDDDRHSTGRIPRRRLIATAVVAGGLTLLGLLALQWLPGPVHTPAVQSAAEPPPE
ncbi:hypothetical protein SAOR_16175 [Salinisphaera orenii MK-B5]|uniref:Uncharacterized protein n=1 Tax=Salinisphaera orenii MK-B5 TaxID=856730 RepID=A0A423PEQ1_9GAMM|nr:hypothetical protein [Salinisphaera orenii]ROO24064.1 hypothetical protein SAOR_16175 [Salinisphaera orenii MK-B5]